MSLLIVLKWFYGWTDVEGIHLIIYLCVSSFHSTLVSDGCFINLPTNIFNNLEEDEEILYIFIVAEQVICMLDVHVCS